MSKLIKYVKSHPLSLLLLALPVEITVSSSLQIALFVAPLLVFVSIFALGFFLLP